MKRHNFFLPQELVDELRSIAVVRHTTVSELIRQAIVDYLEHGRRASISTDTTGA